MARRQEAVDGSLATLLRGARERAGLTQRELATALGVSHVTVLEAESGRDVRASTLARYARHLSDLSPAILLGSGDHAVPPTWPAAWRFLSVMHGYVVQQLTVHLDHAAPGERRLTVTATGVRGIGRGSRGEEDVGWLTRTVFRGSASALAKLGMLAAGKALVVEDGASTHEMTLSRARELTYVRRQRLMTPAGEGAPASVTTGVDVPALRLTLVARLPPGGVPCEARLRVVPGSFHVGEGEPEIASSLYPARPTPTWNARTRELKVEVAKPVMSLDHSLTWSDVAATPARLGGRREAESPRHGGHRLVMRRAREAAGLSMRQLASKMGVAPITVSEIERGGDARRSTLVHLLHALPDLSPWALLDVDLPSKSVDRTEVWRYQRDVFGCEVERETKRLTLTPDGHSRLVLRTDGLRVLRPPRGQEVRLRLGLVPSVLQRSRASLRAIDLAGQTAGVRIGTMHLPDGGAQHVLTIAANLATAGVSFTRKLLHPGVHAMTTARAAERTGAEGPFVEGTSFAALVPARELLLVVRFPSGYWPEDIHSLVWPIAQAPHDEGGDLTPRLHPEGLGPELDRRRGVVRLHVKEPLVGFKYGLGWQLP